MKRSKYAEENKAELLIVLIAFVVGLIGGCLALVGLTALGA